MRYPPVATLILIGLVFGCAGIDDDGDKGETRDFGPIADERLVMADERVASLGLVKRIETYRAASLLPDLEIVRPSVDLRADNSLEVVGRVQNIGGGDAGAFTLRYQVWLFDPGKHSDEMLFEEDWPGVAARTAEESENFLLPDDRVLVGLEGWDAPVSVAIVMTADPWSRQDPRGDVAESNEYGNNIQVYATTGPGSEEPWIVLHPPTP